MSKTTFQIGQSVECVNNKPLPGFDVAPPLEIGKVYTITNICQDSEGNQHLDVGLVSKYNYVRSWETEQKLPNGDKVHWCHPSRFVA